MKTWPQSVKFAFWMLDMHLQSLMISFCIIQDWQGEAGLLLLSVLIAEDRLAGPRACVEQG